MFRFDVAVKSFNTISKRDAFYWGLDNIVNVERDVATGGKLSNGINSVNQLENGAESDWLAAILPSLNFLFFFISLSLSFFGYRFSHFQTAFQFLVKRRRHCNDWITSLKLNWWQCVWITAIEWVRYTAYQ